MSKAKEIQDIDKAISKERAKAQPNEGFIKSLEAKKHILSNGKTIKK